MDDNGSIVLEMCLITLILVCAVFVVMNMLFIAFNHAAASGEAYLVLYNREEYRINESGEGGYGQCRESDVHKCIRDRDMCRWCECGNGHEWEESGCGDNLQRVISGDTDIDR